MSTRASVWLYNADRSAICCADLYERGEQSRVPWPRDSRRTCPSR